MCSALIFACKFEVEVIEREYIVSEHIRTTHHEVDPELFVIILGCQVLFLRFEILPTLADGFFFHVGFGLGPDAK